MATGSSFWAVSNAALVFVYAFSVVLTCAFDGYLLCLVSAIQLLPFRHVPLLTCFFLWDKIMATLVVVGQAHLVPLALHGLAGVYLKR